MKNLFGTWFHSPNKIPLALRKSLFSFKYIEAEQNVFEKDQREIIQRNLFSNNNILIHIFHNKKNKRKILIFFKVMFCNLKYASPGSWFSNRESFLF